MSRGSVVLSQCILKILCSSKSREISSLLVTILWRVSMRWVVSRWYHDYLFPSCCNILSITFPTASSSHLRSRLERW